MPNVFTVESIGQVDLKYPEPGMRVEWQFEAF